ncbi:uncharacterized protein PAC_05819 [Phialocephala subalpina]|uniref:Uncharacterized protein n=1 Tax=Phialocephala subalpina TaxID=576137 RepID=A0A1L7WT50_9HELO|nr:uncharacterized protein PAC_05819 [Phialocephala subalpina]
MHDPDRLLALARAAGAYTKERLPTVQPFRRDSIATSPVDQADAKESLKVQRTSSVYYTDPTKQKRNLLRSKKEKAALLNPDNWTYTKAERYAVLDQQIRQGGPPGLAQAVISFNLRDPLDVNVGYAADKNGDAISTGKSNGWLELVAGRNGRNDVAYIRLLTNFGASQVSRDRALSIALDCKAIETAQELFRNNADPNAPGIADHFLAAISEQNQNLYTMFLTATTPLNTFYIDQALLAAIGQDSDLVALLIAHGADGLLDDGQALCAAISIGNLEQTAMILTGNEDPVTTSLDAATSTACAIMDEKTKVRFLDMLLCAGANADTSTLHDALLEAVKNNQNALVELLTHHGISTDRNGAEGLRLAVISGQIDLVEVLLRVPVPEASTSRALYEANGLEDLDAFEEIVKALVEKGVSQASLNKCLCDVVEKGCTSLAPMLIEKGAILDYDHARCVRAALRRNDFDLFGKLLKGPCQPSVLCEVLPDAMRIQPPSKRLDIMTRLLNKGVSGKQLHVGLQNIAANVKDPTDYSLIEILMRYHASVDFLDENGNCVCTAAAHQDERALDLLCQGTPGLDTVSEAIRFLPVSFATAEAGDYERQVGMMTTLLEKGARGTSVAEMLIKAARDDHREKALAALIRHGANANHQQGKAIEEALRLPRVSALGFICKDCKIEKETFAAQLQNVLKPQGFSLDKATLLVRTSSLKSYGYKGLLDQPLLNEVENKSGRIEVIRLLLDFGASADFQHAQALQYAVATGNVDVCSLLLGAGVKHANIVLAFPATSGILDRTRRYNLMKALAKSGGLNIGQDQALVQASREAIQYDLSHVKLLLDHHASPNFDGGAAVLESIKTKNLPLLKRFMITKLNKKTLSNAFALARKTECTQGERYDMFDTILADYLNENDVSATLIEVVLRDANDIKTSSLLLDHGASVEAENGSAIRVVSSAGSLDLLNLFLNRSPSQNSCNGSFQAATASALSLQQRRPIYHSLLKAGITRDLVSAALLEATRAEIVDHDLLTLLIGFNASLDFDAGSALHGIAARGDLATLNVLLTGDLSEQQTLDRSFSTSMKLTGSDRFAMARALLEKGPGVSQETVSHHLAQIVEEKDHDLLSLVMDYKPDPAYNGGESLILSAIAGDAKSTELLAKAEIPSEIVDQAFEQLLNARTIQSAPEGLQTAAILLTKGVSQRLVDHALLDGFDDVIGQLTKDLVEILIPYNPNTSGGNGKIFVDTARINDVELFRRLAFQDPDLNIVIPALIRALENEEELISFLEHLEDCVARESLLQDYVIFRALTAFPEGHLLAKHLLNHGCPANSKCDAELFGETESMTLLIWTLMSRRTPAISEDVVMEILEEGNDAEVSFQTPKTCTSATGLASTTGKNTVLKRLIELGVDLSHLDKDEHSALFNASGNGHLETAEILIKAGAKGDDGSLHEAAREAHPQVIELLLANGHRDDFPSAIHAEGRFGRTALEELCLNAAPGGEDWPKRIHESIALLLPSQIKNITQSGGKTMIHLALENESSLDVVRELLAFPAVWENINDPTYLYQDAQGYVYSPTKYVELLFAADSPEKCQQFQKLLHARKCKDRFYAHTVDQPEGACGLPEAVAEAVNKQKRADHEQREELKRRNQIAAHQRAIEAENYDRHIRAEKEKHNLFLRQLKEQETTEKQLAQNKQSLALQHARELQRERQESLKNENRLRLEGVNEEAARRRTNAEREQASELAHRRTLDQREASALQSKIAYEQQLIAAREAASQSEYNRQVALCERKDQSARYQAEQRARASQYD